MHDFLIGVWAMRLPIAFALVCVCGMLWLAHRAPLLDEVDTQDDHPSPPVPRPIRRVSPGATRDLLSWDNGHAAWDTEIDPD